MGQSSINMLKINCFELKFNINEKLKCNFNEEIFN